MAIRRRLRKEKIAKCIMQLALLIISSSLLLIIGTILYKGLPYLSWDMISQSPKGGFYIGKEGGVLNAIVGSLYLATASTLLATGAGVPIAIYLHIYTLPTSLLRRLSKFLFDVLFGMPSIVYGAIAFSIMIWFGIRASLLGGIITVSLLTLPIVVRTVSELFHTVTSDLQQITTSLGATRFETAKVLIRYVKPGLFTAVLLAFGRAVGDVAGVLLTTGFTDNMPLYIDEPAATLPLAIFFQLSSPIPEVQGRAYASGLLLTIIILIVVICTNLLASKQKKHKL